MKANDIIKKRINLFNKLIKAMELKKKVEDEIKNYRDEMWGLDNYCSQKWRKNE